MIDKLPESLSLLYLRKLKTFFTSEYFLWIIFGFTLTVRFFYAYYRRPDEIYFHIDKYYFELLLGILSAFFPLIYRQIFGRTPLQSISLLKPDGESKKIVINGDRNVIQVAKESSSTDDKETAKNTELFLFQLAKKAEILADKIYIRSGVYLFFGVLIAFGGIIYFSLQSISTATPQSTDMSTKIIELAPRFGILFFIEFIAFFFLKQYRSAMDEFRHYDAVKRNRESQLAIFLMATKDFSERNFSTVVDKSNFFEDIGRLASGESTELLEASKINKNELDGIKDLLTELTKKSATTQKPSSQ